MSQALQRVAVRMHFDPTFTRAVYEGAALPELGAAERALLLAVDPRAWATDPLRPTRALESLVREFPTASALAAEGGARLDTLHAFFSSDDFHRAVQERASMPMAYGAWLTRLAGDLARLELALARSQRAGPVEGLGVATRPGVVALSVGGGTLARWEALRERLLPDPAAALARGVDLSGLPPTTPEPEHLLVEPGEGGTSVSTGSAGLVGLLVAAEQPLPREVLEAKACELGAEPERAPKVLNRLLREGLLIHR